jgi:hypothetical protein
MVFRYVPLLRAKAGEANALLNLTPAAKARMFPILHLASSVPGTLVARIGQAWAGRTLALDGLFNYDATASGADMQAVFQGLTAAGVTVVPSVEYGAPLGYMQVVGPLAQGAGTGLVVKVRLGQLQAVTAWLGGGGWQPQDVDLVIIAGHIAEFGAGVLNDLVLHSIQGLPNPQGWRSVTLAGSAAPKDMSTLGLGVNLVPRLDWQLWQVTQMLAPFQVDYGDYGIAHPDMTEPPGYVMGNATVSVRYTLDDDWLIIKGRPVTGNNGIPMPAQYLGHAQTLVAQPAFGGLVGCWGDARIQSIPLVGGRPGNRQSWVEIGVNRHLSLVADRLP